MGSEMCIRDSLWTVSQPIKQFHAPDDPLADMKLAAAVAGVTPELCPVEVTAGSAVLHHGRTWHGSRANTGNMPRRSVVAHCMSSDSVFHETNTSAVYSRYKQQGSQQMSDSFFPVIWHKDGYRSEWIDDWLNIPAGP